MFYSDSLEVLIGLKQSLNDCSDILSRSTLDDYAERFKTCMTGFITMVDIIDRFVENWETDEEKIRSCLTTAKDYIDYYIRLCKTSSENNYKRNMKYMLDSIETVSLVMASKITFIKNTKLIN